MSSNTKKKTNFINNHLEYIYFLFRSKTKYIHYFPKHSKTQSESQPSQNPQYSISTSKL